MAVSPLVMHSRDALQNTRSASSPLKNIPSAQPSAQTSTNGTPLAVPNATAAVQSTSLDVAEQLNEEEKRKYIKGL